MSSAALAALLPWGLGEPSRVTGNEGLMPEGQATSARAMGTVVGQACSFDQPSSADTGSKSYQPKWLAFSFPPTFEYSVGYVTPINV